MRNIKKIILIAFIVILAVIEVSIYCSQHFYYKAHKETGPEEKAKILERASRIYPFNDLIYYELGKVYYEMGKGNLVEKEVSEGYFLKSSENFKRSIQINPVSQFSHFHLARSLINLDLLSSEVDPNYFDEYRRATSLVSFSSQIYFEVGKLFLSNWPDLSKEEKKFTLDMLKEIMRTKDREKALALLHAWELNVKDFEVMIQVLPKIPEVYRLYADFLGERSLSLEERRKILNEYYLMEFEESGRLLESGENSYYLSRLEEAADKFKACLRALSRIRFSPYPMYDTLITRSEFNELQKTALLNLSKSYVEGGKDWGEYKNYLEKYLSYDPKISEVNELAGYLEDWNVIEKDLEMNEGDFSRLYFISLLRFKQNQFREVSKLERLLRVQKNSDSEKDNDLLVKMLRLLGDSYQKMGNLYDAQGSYEKALEMDPNNLEILLQMRNIYERLNDEQKILDFDDHIDELIVNKEFIREPLTIEKGETSHHMLLFDGREIFLDFHFGDKENETMPLALITFNGDVIWEGYLSENDLSIRVQTKVGRNMMELTVINCDVELRGFRWRDI